MKYKYGVSSLVYGNGKKHIVLLPLRIGLVTQNKNIKFHPFINKDYLSLHSFMMRSNGREAANFVSTLRKMQIIYSFLNFSIVSSEFQNYILKCTYINVDEHKLFSMKK